MHPRDPLLITRRRTEFIRIATGVPRPQENALPSRTPLRSYAYAYGRVLGGSDFGEFVPGIPVNRWSWLKVRRSFGAFDIFERQVIWDVFSIDDGRVRTWGQFPPKKKGRARLGIVG